MPSALGYRNIAWVKSWFGITQVPWHAWAHCCTRRNSDQLCTASLIKQLNLNVYWIWFCCRCGDSDHLARDCPEGNTKTQCYNCKEMGHIARECPMEQKMVMASWIWGPLDASLSTCLSPGWPVAAVCLPLVVIFWMRHHKNHSWFLFLISLASHWFVKELAWICVKKLILLTIFTTYCSGLIEICV